MKRILGLAAALGAAFLLSSAQAQNAGTVTNHAVPIGKGPGVTGFTSVAPGTAGLPFVSNGASLDPSYQVLGFGGGGTGQTTRAAALNALMPTPTRAGDFAYWNGSQVVYLAGNNSGIQCLSENGSGVPSWVTCGGMVVGTSVISGGTTGRPLYDNGGVLGEYAQVPTGFGGTGADNSTNTQGDIPSASSNNGTFAARSLNALCTLVPSVCNLALGYTSIYWYGAKCDGIFQSNQNFDQPSTNLSITSGQTLLTSSGSTFTSADVGKRIYVPGAGAAGAALSTTIASFVGTTQVNLAVTASTTLSAVAATNTAPFVYGTDDTTAIQNAMSGVPFGGTLYIPGKHTGCVIRQQGANAYALKQSIPFTIRGDGRYSNLMTFPDTPSTVDNLFVDGTSGFDWTNVSWTGFSIGMSPAFVPSTFIMYKRYGKRGLVLSDSTSANFVQFNVTNLMIGESGNDHSLYVGNGTSSPSQGGNIANNKIFGGIHLQLVSDSFKVQGNWLFGTSSFGGLFEFVSGAGNFLFSGNNVTWAGCTVIESGTKPAVIYNYFEEVVTGISCSRASMVDFNGGLSTVAQPTFIGNIVNLSVSTTSSMARFANVTNGVFGDNYLVEGTSRIFVNVTGAGTISCTAPNTWVGGGTHFSTAPTVAYGGC